MMAVFPANLTVQQWLLLQHLHKYGSFFYAERLYALFSAHRIERLEYYRLFFSLVAANYVVMDSPAERKPNQLQDFRYTLTRKGRRMVLEHTKPVKRKPPAAPVGKVRARSTVVARTSTTILLNDYLLCP